MIGAIFIIYCIKIMIAPVAKRLSITNGNNIFQPIFINWS